MTSTTSTDRIEKQVKLKASPARVWRALSDAAEFGTWFGARLDGVFAPGRQLQGFVTIKGYEHLKFVMAVERMEPERLFSYRWHPYPSDPAKDYADEPMTLVEFRLTAQDGGTLLTVVESGFDRIPAYRRDEAFRMNDGGWAGQMKNIRKHLGEAE